MPAMTQETARVRSPITTKRRRINPNYAEAYNSRGNARSELGDKQGAIQDFQKAADLFQKQGDTNSYNKAINNLTKVK